MMGQRSYTYDVAIPIHPKDRLIAKRAVELLRRHAGDQLGTIYVVSPASIQHEMPPGTVWVDQARFPLDPAKMHREVSGDKCEQRAADNEISGKTCRGK